MTDRQLAIFLDGDWGGFLNHTALGQLHDLTRKEIVQTYYEWGDVGAGRLAPNDPVLEQALGAYQWLCERYRDGTDIYLFGWSAGAIAALRLVRLIALAGLLRRPDGQLIQELVSSDVAGVEGYLDDRLYALRRKFSRTVGIRFLGLLDASAPFGVPRGHDYLAKNTEWIADGRVNPIVSHAFSALALDETSDLYEPVQWTLASRRTRSVKQLWFRGSHVNLGQPFSAENPLGLFPFVRLASEAGYRGLALRPRWRAGLRPVERQIGRWVADSSALRPPATGKSDEGLFQRIANMAVLQELDASVSDRRIARDMGSAPTRMLTAPPATAPSSVRLTEGEIRLFELNELKPPADWGRDRRLRDDLPGDAIDYLGVTVGDDDELRFGRAPGYLPYLRQPSEELKPQRFLLAQFRQGDHEIDSPVTYTLKPDRRTWLSIAVGHADPRWLFASGEESFPAADYWNWHGRENTKGDELAVVLSGCSLLEEPQIQHIRLPKRGDSTVATFSFEPMKAGLVFTARVTVLYRNRVLQSALLHAQVGGASAASLRVDATIVENLANLRRRRPADVSVLINEQPEGEGRALIIDGEKATEIAADVNDSTLQRIIGELGDLAKYSPANLSETEHPKKIALLRNLAVHGHDIYRLFEEVLQSISPPGPGRFQVVAAHKAKVYPLEFVYDYPPPRAASPNVKPCPHWKKDAPLEQGTPHGCYSPCNLQPQGDYVCPNGFWGVKKIIERQAFHCGASDAGSFSSADGLPRRPLSLKGAAVLGVSQLVHGTDQTAATSILSLLRTHLNSDPAEPIKNWEHLKDLVTAHGPPLIVLLPHVQDHGSNAGDVPPAAGMYLEIENFLQRASEISRSHIIRENSGPLVVLLGCEAASSCSKYDNSLNHFRRAGAAAVIAPVATVAPANVVRFMRDLAGSLRHVLGKKNTFIGEALRDARRSQFMQGNFLALTIMGFGDGDLRVTLKD